MPHYNFQKDVLLGKEAERDVASLLSKNFNWELLDYSTDAKWDIRFRNKKTGRTVTVETKSDFRARFTGNIAIEYFCRGKKSGIEVTKARYWVYKIYLDNGAKYIFITTDAIKKLIAEKKYHRKVVGGDADSGTKMYLFKMSDFEKKGKVISDVLLPNMRG